MHVNRRNRCKETHTNITSWIRQEEWLGALEHQKIRQREIEGLGVTKDVVTVAVVNFYAEHIERIQFKNTNLDPFSINKTRILDLKTTIRDLTNSIKQNPDAEELKNLVQILIKKHNALVEKSYTIPRTSEYQINQIPDEVVDQTFRPTRITIIRT